MRNPAPLLALGLAAAGAALGAGLEDADAYATHLAFTTGRMAPVLRLVNGAGLSVAGASAAPLDSLALLYDGNPGSLDDARSWLTFDGSQARLAMEIPPWRHVRRAAFTAAELGDEPGIARLEVERGGAAPATIQVERTVVARKGRLALIEYVSHGEIGSGRLRLDYRVRGLAAARLGELMLDGIGPEVAGTRRHERVATLEAWRERFAASQCASAAAEFRRARTQGMAPALRALLPVPHRDHPTDIVFWRAVPDPAGGYTTHSLLLKVDDTGHPLIDVVRAWVVVPATPRAAVPLVVLPQQSDVYGGLEPLGVLGERELGVAPELASHGVASVSFASIEMGNVGILRPRDFFFDYYPSAGGTAKDLDSIARLLDVVLDAPFQERARFAVDAKRVGIWGFSYGAWMSVVAGALEKRIGVVAISHFTYRDEDAAAGLASALYVPQLACLPPADARRFSVTALVAGLGKPAFATLPGEMLLTSWQRAMRGSHVDVAVNPYGHLVTGSERQAMLDFLFRAFALDAHAGNRGAVHDLPRKAAGLGPYVARENEWRTRLVRAMSPP